MDGFKNTTKMKYMCGGPVRKAMGGAIKSVAPKSVAKSAASAKQLPTPEFAPKRQVQPTPPKDVGRELPRPTMEPKRLIAQTPTEDKGREFPRPTMEPKRQVQPTPPKDVRTIGGAPKAPKDVAGPKWMGNAPAQATAAPRGPGSGPAKAMATPRGMEAAKTMGSVGMAKKGVPVASKKPMIGLKTGGYVSKSSFKW